MALVSNHMGAPLPMDRNPPESANPLQADPQPHSQPDSSTLESQSPPQTENFSESQRHQTDGGSPLRDVGETEEGVKTQQRRSDILSVGFNQDFGCFTCGTRTGFRIYNCDPFKETFRRELNNGGIGLVEMLFRCNILAIVGGGDAPRYPPNKVMIWDDHQSRCIGELSFRSDVRGVRLRRDRIVVVLEQKIYVYNFSDLKLLHQIETIANPKGLCALSPVSNSPILACPGLHKGQIRVEHYGLRKTKFISAHDSHLACFTLTLDGRLLATASTKGTLIRIFNTMDGTRLQELRRGAEKAEIYSIAFSSNAHWLVLSSDKGTVHVFSLRAAAAAAAAEVLEEVESENDEGSNVSSGNPGSSLSFMKGIIGPMNAGYAVTNIGLFPYRLPEEVRAIVAFGPQKNTILIVGLDGNFYKCMFDPVHGGKMLQQEYVKFFKADEDEVA